MRVTRGALSGRGPGQYGPCFAQGLTASQVDDASVPQPGDGYFYLVQAQSYDCGLGSLGTTSTEQQRVQPRERGLRRRPGQRCARQRQSTVSGTVAGTLADTASSNDARESITEVLSSGGSPSSRFSLLEHRWTFSVGSGSLKELHVEGFRSSSTDGDDFVFAYSTDGVSFTPLVLSLPFSDDQTERIATLPPGPSGTVTVRVTDADRTAGHQTLDTVSVDELWIRAVP
jgi:hypothetical protein